ncbi:MAG: LysR substrate-binding domain-containing protein, partial [Pseudomonadota bacterium]
RLAPNASAFYVFDAAARLGGFSAAARELGMTQSAVSQSVRALEERLGAPLFRRHGRRATLTDAGARLFSATTQALETLETAAVAVAQRPDGPVTLSASTAFVAWWMAPRLGRFSRRHPEIDLRLHTADHDVDLAAAGFALGVRHGDGRFPGCEAALLCEEEVFPVCAPQVLDEAADPSRMRLIHLEEPHRPAVSWADWFAAEGLPARRDGLRINDYVLVLQAALEGQGVAIGWRHLAAPLIAQGRLARASPRSLRTGRGYWVIAPPGARSPAAEAARAWLLSESDADAAES